MASFPRSGCGSGPPQHHPPQPLLLTVRFSASLPDLLLDIPSPGTTTVVALKHLIRTRLDEPYRSRRLRFIYQGKILPDSAALGSVLKVVPPPPTSGSSSFGRLATTGGRPSSSGKGAASSSPGSAADAPTASGSDGDVADGKGKGKSVAGRPDPPPRTYVNCSIGDTLTQQELEAEAVAATAAVEDAAVAAAAARRGPNALLFGRRGAALAGGAVGDSDVSGGIQRRSGDSTAEDEQTGTRTAATDATGRAISQSEQRRQQQQEQQRTAPRGFDRLLAAGMTPAEVNQLRLQFRSIQAARHTPDNMPSPDTMRSMEDAWLDGNANSTGSATATANTGWFGFGFGFGGGGGGSGGEEDGAASGEELGLAGLVDVMIRGMMIGFLWPLASMTWLLREEGIWSKRWQVFVTFGFLLSITIGLIRGGTKDG